MDNQDTRLSGSTSEGYDASDRPFDFVAAGGETALVCEGDPALRGKIVEGLKGLGYQALAPDTTRNALRAMRFHVFDVIVLNEGFDAAGPEAEGVLPYLANMAMATRRRIFVALIGEKHRTMDNMAAFNRSVNLVVHLKDIDRIGEIVKQGVADHRAFYHVFRESLQKGGKA
ncbi:MAG: hypothetical protein LLG93_17045 [Deltaproteobacteria bacterium]|nr:hypothetical protein [Deltaproteobacteria bacterium]